MPENLYSTPNSDYQKNNPTWHTEDSAWKASVILHLLDKLEGKVQVITEIGCGAGHMLDCLHQNLPTSIRFSGYDIAPDAINMAKQLEKERLSFVLGDAFLNDLHFDLLILADVFEHIEDYYGFLRECHSKSDYTIFNIPLDLSINALLRRFPFHRLFQQYGHLHFFCHDSALLTLENCGYEIIHAELRSSMLEQKRRNMLRRLPYKATELLLGKRMTSAIWGQYSLFVLARNT